jgi:hypothetical protein
MTIKLDFRILSNRRCHFPGCPKRLKQNLVDRNPDAEYCYEHNKEMKKTALRKISVVELSKKIFGKIKNEVEIK